MMESVSKNLGVQAQMECEKYGKEITKNSTF